MTMTIDETADLIEFCTAEREMRESGDHDEYYAAARRAEATARKLPALLDELETARARCQGAYCSEWRDMKARAETAKRERDQLQRLLETATDSVVCWKADYQIALDRAEGAEAALRALENREASNG